MKLREIPISRIKPNPFQNHKRSARNVKDLAKQIQARGLLNPISVVKTRSGYVLVQGHRRLEAFKYLRRTTIPATIRNQRKDLDLSTDLLIENLGREDMTPVEKAEGLQHLLFTSIKSLRRRRASALGLLNRLHMYKTRKQLTSSSKGALKGISTDDMFALERILRTLNISENSARELLYILELPAPLQEKVVFSTNRQKGVIKGYLSSKMAYQLARLKDPSVQTRYARVVMNRGWGVKTFQAVVDEYIKTKADDPKFLRSRTVRNQDEDFGIRRMTERCFEFSSTLNIFRLHNLLKATMILQRVEMRASLLALREQTTALLAAIDKRLGDTETPAVPIDTAPFECEVRKFKGNDKRFTLPAAVWRKHDVRNGDKIVLQIVGLRRSAKATPKS